MTGWELECCGAERPQELQMVSPDTYIERKNIHLAEEVEDDNSMGTIGAHHECISRFITIDEYNNLSAQREIKVEEAIDAYTMQLIEGGVL